VISAHDLRVVLSSHRLRCAHRVSSCPTAGFGTHRRPSQRGDRDRARHRPRKRGERFSV